MVQSMLLTSFATWKPEQISNSSDDLLDLVQEPLAMCGSNVSFLRQLPVDFEHAPRAVIQCIQHVEPDAVICCGMGENRTLLSLESTAVRDEQARFTTVNLSALVQGLSMTAISHDAGRFVCNRLYFDVLDYLQTCHRPVPCMFVHVPGLTEDNRHLIATDFMRVITKMPTYERMNYERMNYKRRDYERVNQSIPVDVCQNYL